MNAYIPRLLAIIFLSTFSLLAQCVEGQIALSPKPGSENPIEVGQLVWISVEGATTEQLKFSAMHYFPRKSVLLLPGQTWSGEPYILFQCKEKGSYLLAVCLVSDEKIITAEYVIVAGKDSPDPGPDPKPDPDPIPPVPETNLWILVVEETGSRPQRFGDMLLQLRNEPTIKKHNLVILDKDATNQDNEPVKNISKYLELIEPGDEIPALIIATSKGRILFKGPSPTTINGFLEIVRSKGG